VKYVKILGLTAVAAMAVMAFVGAGTASATTLCKSGGSPEAGCGAGKGEINAETDNIEGTSSNAILTSSLTDVTCKVSETKINPTSSTGAPILGTVENLNFKEDCTTASGTSCTVTVVNLPYSSSLEGTALTVTDPIGAGATVKCGFLINCTFTTKSATLNIVNGTPSVAKAEGVKLEREGGFCPETAEWHATYSTTAPTGLTVK
jgi:hypothetical protein